MSATLSSLDLPSGSHEIFQNSGFFIRNHCTELPSPDQVRARCRTEGGNDRSARPPPARFPRLGLLVKFGPLVSISEGQCLFWLHRQGAIPVPEIYGWKTQDSDVYLYMELICGITLEERWRWLSSFEKEKIAHELGGIMKNLHSIPTDSGESYIGSVGKQQLHEDIFASYVETPGPFKSVQHFHDFLLHYPHPPGSVHPWRHQLPDDCAIQFTHGDLHMRNILVSHPRPWSQESLWNWWSRWSRSGWTLKSAWWAFSGEGWQEDCSKSKSTMSWIGEALWGTDQGHVERGEPRVVAIIDWHQSGWLPSYWEYCKANWTAPYQEESWAWYLPIIIRPSPVFDTWHAIAASAGI